MQKNRPRSRRRTPPRLPLAWAALTLAACVGGQTLPPDWPYTRDFSSTLLHVHPEVNYALHPDWLAVWERERLGAGAFRAAFGSTATDELLVDARWALNTDLAPRLRLRQDIVWQERRHLPQDRLDLWLGLEWRVRGRWAVVAQAVPASRKEEIDLRLGGLWASEDRTRYVQVLAVRRDVIHDAKDRLGGVTDTSPLGADWLVRLERGRWTLYAQGHWVRRLARRYPDPGRSPVLAAQEQAANEWITRLRWRPGPRSALELAWFQAEDASGKRYRRASGFGDLTLYDHDYAGWYRLVSVRGLQPLSGRWRLRAEAHRLDRRAAALGWRAFRYRREEILAALYAEWSWSRRRIVELGYLGTFYSWRHQDAERRVVPQERRGYADKVEVALILPLAGEAALKLSLSHEVSLERFGGASVRLLTVF